MRTFPSDRVEPLGPEDPVGMRLVIRHDDGTSTVVDSFRWDDEDFHAQNLADYEDELRNGTIDPVEELARLDAGRAEMQRIVDDGSDGVTLRWANRQLELNAEYREILERYLPD